MQSYENDHKNIEYNFQTHNLATCNQTKNLQTHLNQVYPLVPSIETNKRRTSNKPRTRIRRAALKLKTVITQE
ncbi:hypothetical protein BLOT_012955 [Blomia tropicalis]|nr:hypothetical protein BLOT_012955 [Blomia tropicalis]